MNDRLTRDDRAVLRRMLHEIMKPLPSVPFQRVLDPGAHFAARASYFLLGEGEGASVESFAVYTLSRLMRCLNHNTEQQPVIHRGRVRGRVIWPATFKAHCGQDYDPSRYVCREVRRLYDAPENQLLKYMVEQIVTCLRSVPDSLRIGACYFPEGRLPDTIPTASRLDKIAVATGNFQRSVYLREVSLPDTINEVHLLRAETARSREYAEVARIYKRYRGIVASTSWDDLARAGKRALPLPGRADAEGDVWIRFGAAVLRA